MCHRIFQASLSPKAASSYLPYQRLENLQMLNELIDNPGEFRASIRRYTHSLMTQLVLGFRTVDNADPKLQQLYSDFEAWSELLGKAVSVIVDLYQPLRHLPDALLPVRRQAKEIHQTQKGLFLEHWGNARERIQDQTSQVSRCFQTKEPSPPSRLTQFAALHGSGCPQGTEGGTILR